ncbi:MAG: ketopantoate reductase [Gammaproteobacteria bacterium]|jgi:ketopantoate reductase|nr:ketopantoate reductase [Gammaproteobacteria bacterium]
MKYGIIDDGNIGIYLTACLSAQQLDVHFYGGYSAITMIQVTSPLGDFSAEKFSNYQNLNEFPLCDVLFLNINTLLDHFMLDQINRFVTSNGILVLFQKGVTFYEAILQQLPKCTILGALCWLKPTKTSPSTVKHDFGDTINLGVYNPKVNIINSDAQYQLETLLISPFSKSRIKFIHTDNFFHQLWTRYAFNMPYFILSVLYNKFSQEIFHDETLWQRAKEIRQEINQVACAHQIPIQQEQIEKMDLTLAAAPPSYPGLKLDYDNQLPLHLSDIFDGFLFMASSGRINIDQMQEAYKKLLSLEDSYRGRYSSPLRV